MTHRGVADFNGIPGNSPGLPSVLAANSATSNDRALINLAGSPVGRLLAGEVLEIGAKRIKTTGGNPVFEDGKPVFIPVFEGDVRAGDLADACLYFGAAQPEYVPPPAGLYEHTEYGLEVQRRRRMLGVAVSGKSPWTPNR